MTENIDLRYEDLEFEEIELTDVLSWKPIEPGDSIAGRYIKSENGIGKGDGLIFHHLKDTDNQEVSILGSTVLNRKLDKIEPGTIIKIVYKGKATAKNGREYNNFAVLRAKQS